MRVVGTVPARACAAAAAMAAVLLIAAAFLGTVGAKAIGIGESGFYSFSSSTCNESDHTDPVGVLFRGTHAWAGNVADQVARHAGWGNSSAGDQYLWVHTGNGKYDCRQNNVQRADQPDVPPSSRFHVRLWFVPASDKPEYKTVGTPHHEDLVLTCGHAVDSNGSEGSGFDQGRRELRDSFAADGHQVNTEFWGNTKNFQQCDGDYAGSNGNGAIITVNHQLEPPRTKKPNSRATHSTLNGTLFPEATTTEYWFAYGLSPSQGSGYPGKTAVKSSSSGNAAIDVSDAISGLSPNTSYYVRMFARNLNGEVEEGNEIQYSTLPLSKTTAQAHPTNGTPGSTWVSGMVTAGGSPVASTWLNVNFSKWENNQWVLKETLHPTTASDGSYATGARPTGVGTWRVKTVLPSSETVEGSESAYQEFQIKPGLCQTSTFITPHPPVHGQPGFFSTNGSVQVPNSECGFVNGQKVNVNFAKKENGVYVYKNTAQATVVNGSYGVTNWTVGTGDWRVRAVFPAQDWFKGSETGDHYFTVSANGWHIDNLGGTFTADPDISSQGAGKLDVFGRGVENGLWIKSYPVSGGWGSWVSMGGVLAGGPGAVSWSNNRIDVVARDNGGNVAHWYWASGWGADYLGNGITSDPDISSWGPNRLDVFARGASGNLLHKYWGGAGWSGWENMGGQIVGGPGAVSWGVGRIDVVARMTDNTIGHWWWGGSGWNYDNLGGTLTSDPDIASQGAGMLDVFARGAENGLWHKWYTTSYGKWSNWEPRGGYITSGPGAVAWGLGRVDVVARAPDNSLTHWWYD